MMLIVGCEDDAILEPQSSDECTGSYCSLSFPNKNNNLNYKNPKIF